MRLRAGRAGGQRRRDPCRRRLGRGGRIRRRRCRRQRRRHRIGHQATLVVAHQHQLLAAAQATRRQCSRPSGSRSSTRPEPCTCSSTASSGSSATLLYSAVGPRIFSAGKALATTGGHGDPQAHNEQKAEELAGQMTDALTLDREELEDGRWFTRDEIILPASAMPWPAPSPTGAWACTASR